MSPFSVTSPQMYLDINRTKAESMQVPLAEVFNTLQAYMGSSFVNLFNKFGQVFQVYVQADSRYRLDPGDIKNLYVRNTAGAMVPLGTLVDVKQTQGAELITRYNLYPAAAIFGSAAPGFSSGQALSMVERLAEETLPRGMGYDWTSTSYQEKKVGYQAYLIYALAIILVYMVLAGLYESWTSPGAVLLVVPIALVGILLGLVARGYDNDLYTQVGVVLMIALSDNLCTNLVIRRIGIYRLAHIFRDEFGFQGTEVQRKLMDFEARERGLHNWIAAHDAILCYELIAHLSLEERSFVQSLLEACVDDGLLKYKLPRDTVRFYHKTGSMEGVLHDWGFSPGCKLFLFTQQVPDEPAVFDIFGSLGRVLLENPANILADPQK